MNETSELKIINDESWFCAAPISLSYEPTIKFYHENAEVGCLNFGTDPITFTGNVDKSAELFFDAVKAQVQCFINENHNKT